MGLLRRLGTAIDFFNAGLAAIAGAMLISMVLLVSYAVFMRYLFSNPPGWDIEITEYMMLYLTFLTAAWLLKKQGHISIDLIYERLNPRAKLLLDLIVSALGVIICLVLTWYAGASTWDHIQRHAVVTETLKFPKAILLGIIPVGFLLLTIGFVRQTSGYLGCLRTSKKQGEPATMKELR